MNPRLIISFFLLLSLQGFGQITGKWITTDMTFLNSPQDLKNTIEFVEYVDNHESVMDSAISDPFKCYYNRSEVWLIKNKEWRYYYRHEKFIFAKNKVGEQFFFQDGNLVQFKKEKLTEKDTSKKAREKLEKSIVNESTKARLTFKKLKFLNLVIAGRKDYIELPDTNYFYITREEIEKLDSIYFDDPDFKIKEYLFGRNCSGDLWQLPCKDGVITDRMKKEMLKEKCGKPMFFEYLKYTDKNGKVYSYRSTLMFRKD